MSSRSSGSRFLAPLSLGLAPFLATCISFLACLSVFAQDGSRLPPPPPTNFTVPPPVTPPPPPPLIQPTYTLPPFQPPPPLNVPTDVQSTMATYPGNVNPRQPDVAMTALNGVLLLDNKEFPEEKDLDGPTNGITIKYSHGTEFKKLNDYEVELIDGEILVSVKSPSDEAISITPIGKFSVHSNGDVLARFDHGILRITNLDAFGKSIKAQFDKSVFEAGKQGDLTVSIAAGYELIAGKDRLTLSEIRPHDGMARRHFKVLENGHFAICEISVDSILNSNDLIAELRQSDSGIAERRILGDLSKMAAVLNYKNGTQGFVVDGDTAVASQGQVTQ